MDFLPGAIQVDPFGIRSLDSADRNRDGTVDQVPFAHHEILFLHTVLAYHAELLSTIIIDRQILGEIQGLVIRIIGIH
jgi:hypothetical protein